MGFFKKIKRDMVQAFISSKIYTKDGEEQRAILEKNGVIVGIVKHDNIPQNAQKIYCEGAIIPGFVDIQVNGCGGALFNRDMSIQSLKTIHDKSLKHGVTSVYPTLITCSDEQIIDALNIMEQALLNKEDFPALEGLHLEGPFIGKTHRGTHIQKYIRSLDNNMFSILCEYAKKGVLKIITVAPENVSCKYIEQLVASGTVVAIGHSSANAELVYNAHKAGAKLITHLYNGMAPFSGRLFSLIEASFASKTLYASIIPDFIHVREDALRIAHKIMRRRLFAITDASSTDPDETEIILNGEKCVVGNNVVKNTISGSLAGSTVTMDMVYNNLIQIFGEKTAIDMCSIIPSECITNMQNNNEKKGSIQIGNVANFLVVTKNYKKTIIKDVVIYGKHFGK